jgi:hypothetical protein
MPESVSRLLLSTGQVGLKLQHILQLHEYVYPIMQGYVQQSHIALPLSSSAAGSDQTSVGLDLFIISRRSVERPGLRYQRRGIDTNGGVANFVETELITDTVLGATRHVSSFVQTRGSSEHAFCFILSGSLETALMRRFRFQSHSFGRRALGA